MNQPLLLCLCGALALAAAPAPAAEIYKWTDSEGHVHFSDTVPREAEKRAKPVTLHNASAAPEAAASQASTAPGMAGAAASAVHAGGGGHGGGRAGAGLGGVRAGSPVPGHNPHTGAGEENDNDDTPVTYQRAANLPPLNDRRANHYANDRVNEEDRAPSDGRVAPNHAQDRAIYDGHRSDPDRTAIHVDAPERSTSGADEARMRAYNQSVDCYAQFLMAGGGMRPGAAEACGPDLPDPRAETRR